MDPPGELQLAGGCGVTKKTIQSGQLFALLAIVISVIHIIRHCSRSKKPQGLLFQSEMIILALVPLYALDAMFCLTKVKTGYLVPEIFSLFRELYESFVLFAFVDFVLVWLGGFKKVVKMFMKTRQRPQHVWVTYADKLPRGIGTTLLRNIPCLERVYMPFSPGGHLVRGILRGMLQYTVVSVVVSAILLICLLYLMGGLLSDAWGGAAIDDKAKQEVTDTFRKVQMPLQVIKCTSVGLAVYCTLLMMAETERNTELKERFEKLSPHSKFWAIKILVFFTMFQKTFCERVLPHLLSSCTSEERIDEIGGAVQNWLLCFELLFFAVWHRWVYPIYEDGEDSDEVTDVHWYDGSFIQMCRFGNYERQFQRRLQQFLGAMGAREEQRQKLEEMFKYFHPDGLPQFSPSEFESVLKKAGYRRDVIMRLKDKAREEGDYLREKGYITYDQFVEEIDNAKNNVPGNYIPPDHVPTR